MRALKDGALNVLDAAADATAARLVNRVPEGAASWVRAQGEVIQEQWRRRSIACT